MTESSVPHPDELRRVTAYLADQAAELACKAGVGGMETAGSFVSFLAANPERVEAFIADPVLLGGPPVEFHIEGCLSWHGQNGKIYEPRDIRKLRGRHDH